jgi:hypothetical protein
VVCTPAKSGPRISGLTDMVTAMCCTASPVTCRIGGHLASTRHADAGATLASPGEHFRDNPIYRVFRLPNVVNEPHRIPAVTFASSKVSDATHPAFPSSCDCKSSLPRDVGDARANGLVPARNQELELRCAWNQGFLRGANSRAHDHAIRTEHARSRRPATSRNTTCDKNQGMRCTRGKCRHERHRRAHSQAMSASFRPPCDNEVRTNVYRPECALKRIDLATQGHARVTTITLSRAMPSSDGASMEAFR